MATASARLQICCVGPTTDLPVLLRGRISRSDGSLPTLLPTGVGCVQAARSRRAALVLSCADGNIYFGSITWSLRTNATARGSGIFMLNKCQPTCAQGTIRPVGRITLLVSVPRRVHGHLVFTRLMAVRVTTCEKWIFEWKVARARPEVGARLRRHSNLQAEFSGCRRDVGISPDAGSTSDRLRPRSIESRCYEK